MTMRLWLRYLSEKRSVLLLYFLTALLFLTVGSLYHIENLEKLLYATLLSIFFWAAAGVWGGFRYVRRSRRLEEAFRHYEQSGELLFSEAEEKRLKDLEYSIDSAQDLHTACLTLLSLMRERHRREQLSWEDRSIERNDYYCLWTHQIKTPIAAMKLLLEESGLQDRSGFLMKEEIFKIEQYVEMVLTFQRLESISADLTLQEYDLDTLVKKALRKYSVLFINKSLKLDLQEINQTVLTDEKWFVFCLGQLLSNSIKYTPQGGISISAQRNADADRALLALEDTGIGIRSEDLPRIFERGFTGYNGRLDQKSTGIGLYLCRQIFTHLNITIQVESQEGAGTKITLGIPLTAERIRD